MKFKYNILNLATSVCFVFAFLCLMLSYATYVMFYPAMSLFFVAFVLLSVRFVSNYVKHKDDAFEQLEAIEMELASGENGETYVMRSEKTDKKLKRQTRRLKLEKLMPSILSISASLVFLYLIINAIIGSIK